MVVRRLPVEDYSKDEIGMIFWGIGTHLGRGLSQSVLGDRLGHVKDFSREDPLARAYRNKQELSPHTDSCDLVGLACLRDAQSGGVSRLTSRCALMPPPGVTSQIACGAWLCASFNSGIRRK